MNCFACLLARDESELSPEYVYGMVTLVGIEIGSQRHISKQNGKVMVLSSVAKKEGCPTR